MKKDDDFRKYLLKLSKETLVDMIVALKKKEEIFDKIKEAVMEIVELEGERCNPR